VPTGPLTWYHLLRGRARTRILPILFSITTCGIQVHSVQAVGSCWQEMALLNVAEGLMEVTGSEVLEAGATYRF